MSMISASSQALHMARELFSEGGTLPAGLIPIELANSWERSRQVGLTPQSRRLHGGRPARQQRLDTLEENQQLIRHVTPEMQLLWQSLMDPRWTLLCMNRSGVIVHERNAESATAVELKTLVTGRGLSEMELGPTAPSCVLKEARPFTVSGSQHYLCELDRFFCAAAPIRTPDGQLVAALNVSGIDMQPSLWLQDRINFTAISIENRLYKDLQDCSLLHLHADPRLIGTPLEGIIAIDPDGYLLHANRSARSLLGLGLEEHSRLAISLEALLGSQGRRDFSNLQRFPGEVNEISLSCGRRIYARLQDPENSFGIVYRTTEPPHSTQEQEASPFNEASLDKAFDVSRRAFAGEVPILVQGETGTGKEVFAKSLHVSLAADRPFVAINCSAIPSNLIEAELFGYVEGAFTGGRKGGAMGKIEAANGGTLFLDEIGDMPMELQTRLLRVLQERKLTRLGDNRDVQLNIRLISASHRDLETLVRSDQFREDLFYRINGFRVVLPPVRDRLNIRGLIESLLSQLSPDEPKALSPETLGKLLAYNWPGNVRELQQALKVACILSGPEPEISTNHFSPDMQAKLTKVSGIGPTSQSPLRRREQETIRESLARNNGNISATASQLGISRTTLYKKMRE
ncbi:sigma-54-dependent Fis family transcriptional regulator [Metapseudomonas lalkuanensis]|uniref:Sigma-54-dependent Fis family transcriptional regulator n=1 Tax=Metapseudomonas lalkuanensis TaxID=2604832 RepID=A0A5J6QKK6_9GAMM|nr:sigma-54-dependent Fis family transcriptional regulator [Pseudomonas lalkuanensis]QEY63044.1 sigma-54-dependent Fis family transcriptional regulator [Pseudomonas lalkuanensis]